MELRAPILRIEDIVSKDNIVPDLDPEDVRNIGQLVKQNYDMDKGSRAEWEATYVEIDKQLQQVMEEKTFPWPGASNIKFPLITIAVMQYHARAYPALVRGTRPVRARVIGDDPKGEAMVRAKRVSQHMSFQVMEQDRQWEESMDKVLLVQGVMGCAFKKSYYDADRKHNVSEFVSPTDLVINYWAKSVDTAPRITHVLYWTREQMFTLNRRGLVAQADASSGVMGAAMAGGGEAVGGASPSMPRRDIIDAAKDQASGLRPLSTDEDTPFMVLEQHVLIDLDGDGYREPYVAFVKESTSELLRLVARYEKEGIVRNKDGKLVEVRPERFFTKFEFLPSPDGSIYGMGLGKLLGSTNHAIDTLMNQMVDAGTMATAGGGFLARGIRLRGGDYSFRPQEWKRTDSSAEDLHKGVYPLPVREPAPVLMQLLQVLIDFGTRIGMSTDPLTGVNPGQNAKVGAVEATIEQGEKVFSGIYKRTYRALTDEFRKLYRLNYLNPPPDGKFQFAASDGAPGVALWNDYLEDASCVAPSADPSVSSKEALVKRETDVFQLARSTPGFAMYKVVRRLLDAMEVPAIDDILPPPGSPDAPPPPVPPQVQIQQLKNQEKQQQLQARMMEHRDKVTVDAQEAQARIMLLQAQAAQIMQEMDQAKNKPLLELIEAEIKASQAQVSNLNQHVQAVSGMVSTLQSLQQGQDGGQGGEGGGAQQQKPAGLPAGAQGVNHGPTPVDPMA